MNNILRSKKLQFEKKWGESAKSSDKLSNYAIMRTLGTGQFGRVVLVRKLNARIFYAMKILEKQKVVSLKQEKHVIYEKKVLRSIDWPFLVNYVSHFKDNASLYLVLEFVQGGEMFSHLQKAGPFPEDQSRFYAAQVVLSFEYLHFMGIVYRDLKPENLLIDNIGYVRITDFGFAKRIDNGKTLTMCGTPEYLAPEIIRNRNEGYNYSVDWWAVGILLYEMNYGKPPFVSEDPMKVFEKIINARVKIPDTFSKALQNLVRNLLQPDITKRLGCTAAGVNAVKAHEWFSSVNWMMLYQKKIPSPFIPEIKGIDDTANFEEYDELPILESDQELYPGLFDDF